MSCWPTKRLCEIAEVKAGFAWKSNAFSEDSKAGPPIIRIQNLGLNENAALVYYKGVIEPGYWIEEDDLLVSLSGSFKVCRWNGPKALLNQRIVVIRPNGQLNRDFAFYQITQRLNEISQAAVGIAVTNASMGTVRDMIFSVPPMAEQERIVKLLDEADEMRKLRAQVDQRTAALIPALFHEMFGDPAVESNRWPVVSLGQACEFIGGASLPAGVPFAGQPDGLLLLKVGDMNAVGNETFIGTSREWTNAEISTYSRAKKGTVIIPKRGCAIATNKKRMLLRDALLDPNLMGIYPDGEKLTASYLYEWFRLFDLTRITTGSAVPQLNKQDLSPLKIAVPPLSIQNEFADKVTEIRELEAAQSSSCQRLDDLFQSLLHRAFNGEL